MNSSSHHGGRQMFLVRKNPVCQFPVRFEIKQSVSSDNHMAKIKDIACVL